MYCCLCPHHCIINLIAYNELILYYINTHSLSLFLVEESCPRRTITACLTYFKETSAPIKLYYDSKTDESCVTGSTTNPATATPAVKPSTSPVPPEGA